MYACHYSSAFSRDKIRFLNNLFCNENNFIICSIFNSKASKTYWIKFNWRAQFDLNSVSHCICFCKYFFFVFRPTESWQMFHSLPFFLLFEAIVAMDSSFPLSFVCIWNKYFIALLTFVRECDREWNQFSDVMEYEYNIHYMFGFLKVLFLSSLKWNCTISFSLLFTMVKFPEELMSSIHVLFDFNLFVFQNQKLLTYIKLHEQLLFVLLLPFSLSL